jgi:hypothetical protein
MIGGPPSSIMGTRAFGLTPGERNLILATLGRKV